MDTPTTSHSTKKGPLVFAHIGDLHITRAREQNYIDFLSIVSQIETECSTALDFVVLPGDNADNGLPEQYKLVATALKMLSVPVHIIAGDHDMEQGGLEAFYNTLPAAEHLPKSLSVRGVRCLFVDVCGPGKGGPDFRLGQDQLVWLENELAAAKEAGEESIIFIHTYPADLKDRQEAATLNRLIEDYDVALVDMGHTHYNELANNGHTIFAATRSTGQIEEGPVGYSVITIDEGIVSWRFKPLQNAFPLVIISSPADYRLLRKPVQIATGMVEVHAVILSARSIKQVTCKTEGGQPVPMMMGGDGRTWHATMLLPSKEPATITVEAFDEKGWPAYDTICILSQVTPKNIELSNGSDTANIGAWPENGIFGTQLGPNRNAKPLHK